MGKHAWRRLEGKRNPHIPHYSCYRCLSQASGTMVALNWDEPPPGVAGEGQGREGGGYPMAWWNIDGFYISHAERCIRDSRHGEIAGNRIIVQSIRVQHQTTEQEGFGNPLIPAWKKERKGSPWVQCINRANGVPQPHSNHCSWQDFQRHRSGWIGIYLGKGCSI